jgi:tetratricopeptide (TPR) repeat protein
MNSRRPERIPNAAPSRLCADIADIEHYAIADGFGNIVESSGLTENTEEELYAGKLIIGAISETSSLLRLGQVQYICVKTAQATKLLATRDGFTASLAIKSDKSVALMEERLKKEDWTPEAVVELDSTELKEADSARPAEPNDASSVEQPVDLRTPAKKAPIARVMPKLSAPPRPGSASSASTVRSSVRIELNENIAEFIALRRAIERGDISSFTKITEQISPRISTARDANERKKFVRFIGPLSSAIASVLAGDNLAGVTALDAINQTPDVGPTLTWAALFWSARASVGLQDGLESALGLAESAVRVAKKLDVETRISSQRLLAEVCYHRGDAKSADRYIELAIRLVESQDNQDNLADLSLLRAKVALLGENHDGAIAAAEDARRLRPDWTAPTVFLCQCVLARSDVSVARELLRQLIERGINPPEVVRLNRLVGAVEAKLVPATKIAEFIKLEETPPTRANLERLAKLVEEYPRLYTIADVLGWKYLKSNRIALAKSIFDRLALVHDLPDDVKSSVLLAIGCLKSVTDPGNRDGQYLQTVVDAAPTHLKSERPPARQSAQFKAAKPVELVGLEPPPSSLAYGPNLSGFEPNAPKPQNRVFSGNLAVFALPELLEFLRAGRRTGTLVCSSANGLGAMQLVDGKISGAVAPSTPRFQELVADSGVVPANILAAYLSSITNVKVGTPLGTLLVQDGLITKAQLEGVLTKQILLAVTEMLQWSEGQFAFEPEGVSPMITAVTEIALDPQGILLDIYRTLDENGRT